MFPVLRLRAVLLTIATLVLLGCQGDSPISRSGPSVVKAGFKTDYLVARAALERGQFSKAERGYAKLLKKSGPLQARIRLEYAHTLLRNGKFAKASEGARIVASQLDGVGRSAALAVQGTADQELARRAINKGIVTSDAIQRLVSARGAYDEVLKNHPQLDPLGGLALRRKTLDIEISTIN